MCSIPYRETRVTSAFARTIANALRESVLLGNGEVGSMAPGKVVALLVGREVDVIRSGFMLVTPIMSSEWSSYMRSRQPIVPQ